MRSTPANVVVRVSYLLLTMLLVALAGPGPALAARGGPDAFGYTWVDSDEPDGPPVEDLPFATFESFRPGRAEWLSPPDLPLPFRFYFYDRGYDAIQISDNGWVSFLPQPDSYPVPTMLPTAGQGPNAFVAPLWSDLQMRQIDWGPLRDVEGYRVYWIGIQPAPYVTADFLLYLFPDGRIRFTYLRALDDGTSAVGLEDERESLGTTLQFLDQEFDGFDLRDGYAVEFRPPDRLACGDALPIACGETLRGRPPAVPPDPDARVYCNAGPYKAGETVYRLDLDRPMDVAALISGFDPRDLDLFFLRSCSEMDCLSGGGDAFAYEAPGPGTYYFVVDGVDSVQEGPFEISLECDDPYLPLGCGETLAGSTVGRRSRKDEHPCHPTGSGFQGPDSLYTVCLPDGGTLRLDLEAAADLDLAVYHETVDPESCVAWGDTGLTHFGGEPGCYHVFVDGPAGTEGEFTLSATCGSLLDCAEAGEIGCGETVSGDTGSGGPGRVEVYPCSGEVFDGPEAIYSLTNPKRQNVSLVLGNGSAEVDLLLARECDEGYCFRAADKALHVADLEPGIYTVYVDGRNGSGGPFTLTATCGRSIAPEFIDVTLDPGASIAELKEVYLTPDVPKADVMFSIDVSLSMVPEIAKLKSHAREIITRLQLLVTDLQFGVIGLSDYPSPCCRGPENCGFDSVYGETWEEPYTLHLPLTDDIETFMSTLPSIFGLNGRDGPEAYGRALWESANDPAIGWRPGSRRIFLQFGDHIPHDCEVDACVGGGLLADPNTGKDPGRDELAGTADDIPILDALDDMAATGTDIVLLEFFSSDSPEGLALWDCFARRTGGSALNLEEDGSAPSGADLTRYVRDAIAEEFSRCETLTLVPSPGYEDWLVSLDPAFLTGVQLPAGAAFRILLAPPPGTPNGIYRFTMDVSCDGVVVARQQVTIRVGACTLSAAASADPEVACRGTPIALDAAGSFADACDGQVQYRWSRNGVVIREFDPSPSASDVMGSGASTYTVEMACIGGDFCDGSSRASVEVFATPDPIPPPIGSSLRVLRSVGPDLRLVWTDLPVPGTEVGGYQVIHLTGDPVPVPEPPAMEAAPVVATVAPGTEEADHPGARTYQCGTTFNALPCLGFYKVRATSFCTLTPGPACDGFPAQVPCP